MALDSFFPPMVVQLLADSKEFNASIDKAGAKLEEFSGVAKESSGFATFAARASTAILAVGAAAGGIALDKAYKFQEGLDAIQNQTGATKREVDALGASIEKVSGKTGILTPDLLTAGEAIEAAGIRGARARQMLNDSAEAAVVTGQSATSVAQALVAAENLHVAAGLRVAQVTGLMVAGAKDFEGGISGVASMLSGRVGASLANYNLNLKNSISMGAVFSRVGLPTRSITSFVNGMGKVLAPIDTVSDSTGKLERGLSSYYLDLQKVGLSQTKLAADLRSGNIAGFLLQIKDAAEQSHQPLAELMNIVLGSTGGAAGSVLLKDLSTVKNVQNSLNNAGSKSLQSSFETAVKQLGPQMKILEANFDKVMVSAGKYLLPAAADVERWANEFFTELEHNKNLRDVLGYGGGALFGAAAALKIGGAISRGVQGVEKLFGHGTTAVQTTIAKSSLGYLEEIAANTAKMAGLEGANDTELAGAGLGGKALKGGGLLAIADTLGPLAVGYEGIKDVLKSWKNPSSIGQGGLLDEITKWISGGSPVTFSPEALKMVNAVVRKETDRPNSNVLPGFNSKSRTKIGIGIKGRIQRG